MTKENSFKIEYVIYLFPFAIVAPNLFYDHVLLSKIRLEHFLLIIIFFYMIVNFIRAPWLPKLMILLIGIWLSFHLLLGLIFTDFSTGDIRKIKLLGYVESYLSFILIIFFIDYYFIKYPNKIKHTLDRLIKNFILSGFIFLSLVILIFLNYKNNNFFLLNLFSSDSGMYSRAYNIGRYLGPIAMPIEAGFYSAFGMIVALYAYTFRVLSGKFLFIFSFLVFNIIGFVSGSKVYLLGLIIFSIALLTIYFIKRQKIYKSIFYLIILLQIIIMFFANLIISPAQYEKNIYILKYYNLKNYNKIDKMIRVVSGGRIDLKKQKIKNDDLKIILEDLAKITNLNNNTENLEKIFNKIAKLGPLKRDEFYYLLNKGDKAEAIKKLIKNYLVKNKKFSQAKYQYLETLVKKPPKYFEYQGAFDSQHRMIKSHGGTISLIFLLFLYIMLFLFAVKIYFANKVLGIFFISLTLLILLTSTGFPVFFSNVMVFFNCIVIYSLLTIRPDKIKFWE